MNWICKTLDTSLIYGDRLLPDTFTVFCGSESLEFFFALLS